MDSIARAAVIYFFLLLVLRLAGRRTMAQATPFDLALILMISEALQQALVDNGDNSLATAAIVVVTLVGLDVALSVAKVRWPKLGRILDGAPLLLVENGRLINERATRACVSVDDILAAARSQGVDALARVRFAILEVDGSISIIPRDK